jgi:hypothetical protein
VTLKRLDDGSQRTVPTPEAVTTLALAVSES